MEIEVSDELADALAAIAADMDGGDSPEAAIQLLLRDSSHVDVTLVGEYIVE